jgi:hypothetical protein
VSDDNFGEEEKVFIPRERAAGSRRAVGEYWGQEFMDFLQDSAQDR